MWYKYGEVSWDSVLSEEEEERQEIESMEGYEEWIAYKKGFSAHDQEMCDMCPDPEIGYVPRLPGMAKWVL